MRLFLEGNIGAGKSSFLQVISSRAPEILVAFEPCDTWLLQDSGKALLAKYYKSPKRWAYLMELVAMTTRVQAHLVDQEESPSGLCRVVERSIYSGHYCFALDGHKQGFFTEAEWNSYMTWFGMLVDGYCRPPEGFIYLEVAPEICHQRVCKRGRVCEKVLDVRYLERMRVWHDKFLVEKLGLSQKIAQIPVLRVCGDTDFVGNEAREKTIVESVRAFIACLKTSRCCVGNACCAKSL